MSAIEAFLLGLFAGVIGTLGVMILAKRRARSSKPNDKSEPPGETSSSIGHDRGIEMFDD